MVGVSKSLRGVWRTTAEGVTHKNGSSNGVLKIVKEGDFIWQRTVQTEVADEFGP